MSTQSRYRQAIVAYLDDHDSFISARDITTALNLPYKTTVDALNALHNMERVARVGRKFSAKWGSKRLQQDRVAAGWQMLAGVWFGGPIKS